MKKIIALLLALVMVLGLAACSVEQAPAPTEAPKAEAPAAPEAEAPAEPAAPEAPAVTEISLWTYPIGGWGTQETVDGLLADFNAKYPNIKVTVEYLTYGDGDDKVNTAIEGNAAPDIVMEGPERLVANWGAKGKMVDLSDLWATAEAGSILESVAAACKSTDGAYYEYPLCMTAHCMAINKRMFEEADALQYIDLENHTWTTENFVKAVEAVNAKFGNVGAIYCSGQAGDQGTRALINNLYSGTFTNETFTAYTADSAENVKALELLVSLKDKGIAIDAGIDANGEIPLFRSGALAMSFCWNAAQHINVTNGNEIGKTNTGDEIIPMNFPTDDDKVELCGGIWGFGIFNNGDDAKIEAAKTFIKYICNENPVPAVEASGFLPVSSAVTGAYANTELADTMAVFQNKFLANLGAYYQVVPGWATARTEWWNMLQRIGAGGDVATETATFVANANAAAGA